MIVLVLSVAGLFLISRAQKTGGLSGAAARISSDVSGIPILSGAASNLRKGVDSVTSTVQSIASQLNAAAKTAKPAQTDNQATNIAQTHNNGSSAQQAGIRLSVGNTADVTAKQGSSASVAVAVPAVPVNTTKPAAPAASAVSSAAEPKVQQITLTDYWGTTGMSGLKVYEYGKALLGPDQQKVYDAIKQAVENLQSSVTIVTPCGLTDFDQAYEYYSNDHVEVFYMHGGISYAYRKSGSQYTYILKFSYDYSAGTINTMRAKIDSAALSMIAQANAKAGSGANADYNRELALHDELINFCSYDTSAASDPYAHLESFTAYGALVNGEAVCDGYARSMKLLLSSVGIRCLYVTGAAVTSAGEGSHAWNMVYVPGSDGAYHWFYLDATFDDPVVYSKGAATSKQVISYNYFNYVSDKSSLGTQHILGAYNASDPQDSDNYAAMPQVG